MSSVKLSAPVGISPRKSDGAKVANKKPDVMLVQEMLRASGMNVAVDGVVNVGLLKAILAYQIKVVKLKQPDQVIDPGGATFKALIPAYKKKLAELAKQKLMKVRYQGNDIFVTEAELKKVTAKVISQAERMARVYRSQHKFNESVFKEYNDTAMMKDGILDAVTQGIIVTVGRVKMIDVGILIKSSNAVTALEIAIKKKDLKGIEKTMPEAVKALNAFNADVNRFLQKFIGSAQNTVTVLEVTKTGCFMVVGALAAPVVVSGLGVSAATAAIATGGGVAVLESAAMEIGKHAAGQKLTVWDSVKSVGIDGTIGVATAGISKKLPLKFVDDIADGLAAKVAGNVKSLSGPAAKKFVTMYLKEGMGDGIKSALSESVKIVGNSAKKGKMPTEKEFKAAFSNIVLSSMTAGPLKNLKKFEAQWAMKNHNLVSKKIAPDILAKYMKKNALGKVEQAAIIKAVTSKVADKTAKFGLEKAFDAATGKEGVDGLVKTAETATLKDKKTLSIVEKAIQDELKKRKVPVK